MSNDRPIPPSQTEVEGWMVLDGSSAHDSNESNLSEEESVAPRKRKVTKGSLSPRAAKSPRLSINDISVKSTGPLSFGSQHGYSLGTASASASTITHTGASGSGQGNASVSKGDASISLGSSGVTRLKNRLPGVSSAPRPIQRSSIPDGNGSHFKIDRPKVPRSSQVASTAQSSASASTLKAKEQDHDNRSTSSDSLPEPSVLLRSFSSPTTHSKRKDPNVTGNTKDTARRKLNRASNMASITGRQKAFNARTSNPDLVTSVNKPHLVDDAGVIVISSDSEVEAQITVKKSYSRHLQSSTRNNPADLGQDNEQTTKAFLSDSDGAIDLTNDQDIPSIHPTEQTREAKGKDDIGRLPKTDVPDTSLRSSIVSRAHVPVQEQLKGSNAASHATQPDRYIPSDLESRRTTASPVVRLPLPANNGDCSNRQLSSKISTPVAGSSNAATKTMGQTQPSLADVISTSLGGTSSTPKVHRPLRPLHDVPRPTQLLRSSSSKVVPPRKLAPPAVGTEIIDLCDSDEPMDADDVPASELVPSRTLRDSAVTGDLAQPTVPQDEGKSPVRLTSVVTPPRVSSPHIVPTSSSLPNSSPLPPVLSSISTAHLESIDMDTTFADPLAAVTSEFSDYPNDITLSLGDAVETNPEGSSNCKHSARSNSPNPSVKSSDKGSYGTRSPSSPLGSLQASRRSSSFGTGSAPDIMAPLFQMHLDARRDSTGRDPNKAGYTEEDMDRETLSEGTPAVTNDSHSSVSERLSPATSSGMGKSAGTRSETSELSVQRARKTTRKDTARVYLDVAEAISESHRLETMEVDTQYDATVTTLSKPLSTVKEPDFSKLRADVPPLDGRLSAAIKWPAEKVPVELHEMINHLPLNYHYNPQMKHIFEAMMEENTADDEPTSPRIEIYGGRSGPVTPPWEFYYTNKVLHGEGVPRSNKRNLEGCSCIGPCDPKSKTCACVKRQMAWVEGDKSVKGFLYNKKGKLLDPSHPVFECNDACECSEDCMNRVIQRGRRHGISIIHTKTKGWGVFADEKIPRGTYMGIYAGEMVLESEANERGKLYDEFGRTYLFDMDFYHLRKLDEDCQKRSGNEPLSQASPSGEKEARFSSTYTIDAFHVGNFTRFLNHSCDPNCQITASYVNEPDLRKPRLTIYTCRDVRQGEELTFAYFGTQDDDEEEEADEVAEHGQVKVKLVKETSTHKKQAVHIPCLCGAANCRGQMF